MEKRCTICDASYQVKPFRAEASKFCSKVCWSKRSTRTPQICLGCHKPFTPKWTKRKACSLKCAGIVRSGEKHFRWKGGTSTTEREKQQSKIAKWRKTVYRRDGYTCQHCGTNENLNAHHIREWADFPRLRFVVPNGLTLCETCHGAVHGKDFSNRRVKHCSLCYASTSGRSPHCRSCSIRLSWRSRKAS